MLRRHPAQIDRAAPRCTGDGAAQHQVGSFRVGRGRLGAAPSGRQRITQQLAQRGALHVALIEQRQRPLEQVSRAVKRQRIGGLHRGVAQSLRCPAAIAAFFEMQRDTLGIGGRRQRLGDARVQRVLARSVHA